MSGETGAIFSECRRYRYQLWRRFPTFREDPKTALWIMLNPSTADEKKNDPTITRCINFSRLWGFNHVLVGNLFAFRATNPANMRSEDDPIGPDNDTHLQSMMDRADLIMVAWGIHGAFRSRARKFAEQNSDRKLFCLGVTEDGHPKHPLYLPKDSERIRWGGR